MNGSDTARAADRPHHRLRVLRSGDHAGPDLPAVERVVRGARAVSDLLTALGKDPGSEHLAETPRRVARSYLELLTPPQVDLTTFPNDAGYDELVQHLPVQSLCEHHLLPFHGTAHIGYLPGERILGLSKLARMLELFARDLQVQERLTQQVADWLQEHLAPRGVAVVIQAEHLCMSLRGVRSTGARTVTSALHGAAAERRAVAARVLRTHRQRILTGHQFVIVGAGLAGAKVAETLRADGFAGRVLLVGAEAERPYERPPLSKDYLARERPTGQVSIDVHEAGWYEARGIELIPGVRADPARLRRLDLAAWAG